MTAYALRLTCCCGGEIDYVGTSMVAMSSERDAFNRQHVDCRSSPPTPVDGRRAARRPIAGPLNRRTT